MVPEVGLELSTTGIASQHFYILRSLPIIVIDPLGLVLILFEPLNVQMDPCPLGGLIHQP